jgi:Txe/YoeB family toxin of Txe-Axe toxin-antitoxin module
MNNRLRTRYRAFIQSAKRDPYHCDVGNIIKIGNELENYYYRIIKTQHKRYVYIIGRVERLWGYRYIRKIASDINYELSHYKNMSK